MKPYLLRSLTLTRLRRAVCLSAILGSTFAPMLTHAHIIPPEKLHPVAEAYRRANFVLNLNPVKWDQIRSDGLAVANYWRGVDHFAADKLAKEIEAVISKAALAPNEAAGLSPMPRQEAASRVLGLLTKAVVPILRAHLHEAERRIGERAAALDLVHQAQGAYGAFEDVILASDPDAAHRLGQCWLKLAGSMGTPGLLGVGEVQPDRTTFRREAEEILQYLGANYGEDFSIPSGRKLAPWPMKSPTFNAKASLPIKLPPGSNVNKQIPRPRQILNMTARGVDESETALIALGDMAFDSAYIYGEPMRSLGMSCNTCHNKSITNPNLFIPGLSVRPGGMDVSNGYFAPHANNGHFDPLDTPDLRGIRFTAPYGRNGRFASLREFVRNVIVNEFNGPEPDPMLVDGMIAYMNEFDFLTNPALNKDGSLNPNASASARRGEKIFHRPFRQMNGMSCATCHIPSANFLDHRRHDIGSVTGYEASSRDRALDTPTLLSAKYTPPYFHDGSLPTLRAVNEWFDKTYKLALSSGELDDLTAYVETVADGVEAYEHTPYYLDAEMEEFSFFLSAFEFLDEKNKPELMNATFQTVALEIRNHKWELQDPAARPVLDQLVGIMDEAYAASQSGDRASVRKKVEAYRALYQANVERLK
jgi:cytochrome c peroxidase